MKEEAVIKTMLAQAGLGPPGAPAGPDAPVGAGYDAAVFRSKKPVVISTDLSVEGVHFDLSFMSAQDAAWRAVCLAATDLPAQGARPLYTLVSLCLPPGAPAALVRGLARGVAAACAHTGLTLLGGDTTRGPVVSLDVVALGEQLRPLPPTAIRHGDRLGITGAPGLSMLGLEKLQHHRHQKGSKPPAALSRAYRHPMPDLPLALSLVKNRRVLALTDVSDGLVRDAGKLAGWAGLWVSLEESAIPLPPPLGQHPPLHYALSGGEDALWLVVWRGDAPPKGVIPLGHFTHSPPSKKCRVWLKSREGRQRPVTHHGFEHF